MSSMTPRLALRDGFNHWLDDVVGGSTIPIGRRLYPFVTSMRSTARMVGPLEDVYAAREIAANDQVQALADLAFAGLVKRTESAQTLTALGLAVLMRWRELDLANDDEKDEAARCAALVRAGVTHDAPLYAGIYQFWCELVQTAPADYWFQDIYTLCMPCYLDQIDSNGFNPFTVLVAATNGHIGTSAQWQDWARDDELIGPRLSKLLGRVRDSFRIGGCRAFCYGMEAVRLATMDPAALPGVLQEWEEGGKQ